MCSRRWACSGSVHAFVGLVMWVLSSCRPSRSLLWLWASLALRDGFGAVPGTVSPFGFLALSVEFYTGCSAPLARTSQVGLVALSSGEALTRLLGPLLLDPTLLLIDAETAGGVMTKLIVRDITVLGALNSDVHAKLPFLLESSLADVPVAWRSNFVFGLFSARLHEAPCSWQVLFFLHLLAVDSLDVLNPRNSQNNKINDLQDIDLVPSNIQSASREALLYVFEDNEAVIKMIMKGRSPTMRHVSRTHRVALDWLFDRINLDSRIQIIYNDTKKPTCRHLYKRQFHA